MPMKELPATVYCLLATAFPSSFRLHPSSFHTAPLPEDSRAHPHERRALLDGRPEVVAHASRELTVAVAEHAARAQLVAEGAQPSEVAARTLRVLEDRRDRHHAP